MAVTKCCTREVDVNDDLCQVPNYIDHEQSPHLNQLFPALYDLVLYHIPKKDLIVFSPGRSIVDFFEFEKKIPNYGENDGEERHWF